MKKCILLGFILSCGSVFAQGAAFDYVSIREEMRTLGSTESMIAPEDTYKKLEGSPYQEEEFQPGVIVRDGEEGPRVFFRYDILKDQVETKVNPEDSKIFVFPQNEELAFRLRDYTYFLDKYRTEEGVVLFGYFMRYYEGDKVALIGKSAAKVTPARAAQTSYDQPEPPTIKTNTNYYLQLNDQPLIEVKIKERHFRKILGNANGMKKYFKEHKVREIEDVVEMLKFYEEHN